MTQTKRGRPREYRDDAEKAKAYRERKKLAEQQQDALLQFVAALDQRENSLRNSLSYWKQKGRKAEIRIHKGFSHYIFAEIAVDGRFNSTTDSILCDWLIAKGALVLTRNDWNGKFYQFAETTEENS